jgi:CubicO group peptidase (beta-lactamase class C family)
MKDSGYDSNAAIILHRASGYSGRGKGLHNAGYIDMTVPFSAGGLYSTSEDLLRWEQGLFGGKVLSPASLKKMTTPFLSNYAFGLAVTTRDGRQLISHNGGIEGFTTHLGYYPKEQLTVVVLSNMNTQASDALGDFLGTLALGGKVVLASERKAIAVSPDILQRYVGSYQGENGITNVISLEGNQLMTKLGRQEKLPIFPESESLFFLKVVDAEVEFVKDGKGKVSALILHQGGRDIRMTKLESHDNP